MPFQIRNKRKKFQNWVTLRKQKIAIKKRLIEISIRIDGYIYRNKPISVEESEKYLVEIASHQTQCNDDVHILQVIEKLTRCLKTIIEETKKSLPPNPDVDTSVNDQSIDLLHSITNKHEDSNILDYSNFRDTTSVSKSKGQDSNIAVVIIISDSEDEEKRDDNAQLKSPSLNTYYRKPIIAKAVSLKDLTTQYTQSNKLSNENNKQLNPDESYGGKTKDTTKEIVNNNGYLIVTKVKKPRQYKKKNNKNVENAPQTSIRPIEAKNIKKKKTTEVTEKPLSCGETLKLDTAVNTIPNELKMAPKKTKNRVPKKKTNKDLSNTKNKRKKSTKNNDIVNNKLILSNFKEHNTSPSSIAPLICTPIKHKHIDISDEVPRVSNDAISNTISNENSGPNKIGAFTIYNERAVDDLSWVESIRYVREISVDEFEAIPTMINENFWNDFSLPYEWKDSDFL